MHIAIGFDANYLRPFYALLASILINHKPGEVVIHAIASGIESGVLKQITEKIRQSGNQVIFYSVDGESLSKFVTNGTWTKAVYYRLYFPLLVGEDVKRLIYLDSDTLVLRNLIQLNELPLRGFPVAATIDNYVSTQPLIGITEKDQYFNSGVLVMDVASWRQQQVSEHAFEYLVKYPERIKFVDQCALNAILHRSWKRMDERYNFLYSYVPPAVSGRDLQQIVLDISIVHFTLQRPWHMLCTNRLRHYYFKYYKASDLAQGSPVIDFSWHKVPDWLAIRFREFYHDSLVLQKGWRFLKRIF